MSVEYRFEITSPIEVGEAETNKLILKGIFIRLAMPTKNGRIYQVEEAEQITKDLRDMPVFFGANEKGLHILDEAHRIGKVIEAVYDKVKNLIHGAVEVINTDLFPDLLSKIKKGWGLSIGGAVKAFKFTGKFNEKFQPIVHALGMKANHIALLEPQVKRGDPAAQVDDVIPVGESLEIDPCSNCTRKDGMCPTCGVVSEAEIPEALKPVIQKMIDDGVKAELARIELEKKNAALELEKKTATVNRKVSITLTDKHIER